jgi:quercetin dioxygenase-like cupin family protein
VSFLRCLGITLALACITQPAHAAPQPQVHPLIQKDVADVPGKEVVMITVDYPPGTVEPIHRHDAQVLVYVLEGTVIMQVRGGKQVTLTPGQTFYEDPNDVHTVGRNASTTKPAKFVVVLLKNKGANIELPAK